MTKGFEFINKGALFGYYLKFGNNTFLEVFKGASGEVGNINHLASTRTFTPSWRRFTWKASSI